MKTYWYSKFKATFQFIEHSFEFDANEFTKGILNFIILDKYNIEILKFKCRCNN